MIMFLAVVMLTSTMMLSMICFWLIVNPSRILGVIAYFANQTEDWHQGKIDLEREKQLYAVTRRVEKIVLFALFGWSVFCGAMLGLIDLIT
jgi:hypothetical protein